MRTIDVGILKCDRIKFEFIGAFSCENMDVDGLQTISIQNGLLLWNGKSGECFSFSPKNGDARFVLNDVVIGVGFHWQRKENQTFSGELMFIIENNQVRAINRLPVEDYLVSVISSEMSATSSLELLKAHTIISRSWLYAQLQNRGKRNSPIKGWQTEDETVRWYDRDNHMLFDLCADDHCQRYQGLTRAVNPNVRRAVKETENLVLKYDGKVCDARFSKCCGGMTERFSACWENEEMEYLKAFRDTTDETEYVDLTKEDEARRWIENVPDAFCSNVSKEVMSQILNGYDCETNDFYRWKVRYSQSELSKLLVERSGINFGTVLELQPIERAASGRLVKLRIVGTKRVHTVGKELEIRRWLSASHLYSSAFVIDKEIDNNTGEIFFLLKGAGWGHGVGLCQIGAAVMGEKGYDYKRILAHYYPGTCIEQV